MSVRATNWAWETGRRRRLKQGELLILIRVADHADNDGKCWPGVEGIADYTAMDESTVRRNLKKLEAKGLLHRERREVKQGRGRRTDAIVVHLDQAGESPGSSTATNRAIPDDQPGIQRGPYIEEPSENHPPSEVGDQRSPTSSGPAESEKALRLCRFLTQAGGENPDEKRYGAKQLKDAAYLLERKDPDLLKAVVEWAHGRTYWAPKVVTPTTLRRWWDQLLADYRAGRRQGAGARDPANAMLRQISRQVASELPEEDPNLVASAVFMLKRGGKTVTAEAVLERLRQTGHASDQRAAA